ncbi:HD-GYP domain-containing protein [Alkalicoccobacillus murimartini]|uniref:HD-GYP domain-containing protein (C-di-GMP phosphodiesterase class II) n=1 Tax=Alkalicoccobacillus murimartini TaxID=171685 RepID=A0ABT9YMQ1_9BACI|nr:HD-GYP domain-containing protein [Alkalicoccobacillus murimartini]MDQ0209148.1 HD-GYP domain-containing protein (c-di-GMP phosphodiesterase class II) [Alkalicoccobacillus murimartini]
MLVPTQILKEGCIVQADVFALASVPLIKRHTVLTNKHLEFLKAFFIKEVDIEYLLEDGEVFSTALEENLEVEAPLESEHPSFLSLYSEAIRVFKKNFESWQAGMPVSIHELRKVMDPLFEEVIQSPFKLMSLHEYAHRKDYRYHHSVSVALIAAALGHKMNYETKEWIQIGLAGLLSDIGMAKISPAILDKSGPLMCAEFEEIKKHPVYSYKMIKNAKGITAATKLAVLQHHERSDNQGYPFGVALDKIHPYSEIIAIADVYHAMSSERKYRSKQSTYYILEEMRLQTFGALHIPGVLALTEQLLQFSIGASVRLNTGEVGEIVFISPNNLTRPMIKQQQTGEIIDLQQNAHIHIEDILNWNKKTLA